MATYNLADILPTLGPSSYAFWTSPQGIKDLQERADSCSRVASKAIPIAIVFFAGITLVATGVIFHFTLLPLLCTAGFNLLIYRQAILPRQKQCALEAQHYEGLVAFSKEGSDLVDKNRGQDFDSLRERLLQEALIPGLPSKRIIDSPNEEVRTVLSQRSIEEMEQNAQELHEDLSVRAALFEQMTLIQKIAREQFQKEYAAFQTQAGNALGPYKTLRTSHAGYLVATAACIFSQELLKPSDADSSSFRFFSGTFSDLGLSPKEALWDNLTAFTFKAYVEPQGNTFESLLTHSQVLCERWVANSFEGLLAKEGEIIRLKLKEAFMKHES